MDKRKQNGGHSTKSKGVDKRKNEYKKAIENAITLDDVERALKKCIQIGISDDKDRMQALKLLLEYTVGKPKETVELEGGEGIGLSFNEMLALIRGDKQ
jgi:hypothetical protein